MAAGGLRAARTVGATRMAEAVRAAGTAGRTAADGPGMKGAVVEVGMGVTVRRCESVKVGGGEGAEAGRWKGAERRTGERGGSVGGGGEVGDFVAVGLAEFEEREVDVHGGAGVIEAGHVDRGDGDGLGRIPRAGVHEEFAERPGRGVHPEAAHGADRAIGRLQVITGDGAGAAEVDVVALEMAVVEGVAGDGRQFHGGDAGDDADAEVGPVGGPPEVGIVGGLGLAGDGSVGVDGRAGFDLVPGEVDGEDVGGGIDGAEGIVAEDAGRQQHKPAGEPVAGVGDDVADHPGGVVEVEVLHVADGAVGGAEGAAVEIGQVAKHRGG